MNKRKNNADSHNLRSLVLLGDSITEHWLGTGLGYESKKAIGIPEVLEDKFQSSFDPVVLAISGDQTQHLLYRMMNGQLPSVNDEDAIFVVMIGTNNLGSGELPGPSAKGVLAVADYILSNTKGVLLLFQVLPRGDGFRILPMICPPRCSSTGEPFKSFIPAVNKLNEAVKNRVEGLRELYGKNRLVLMDCGSNFIEKIKNDSSEVNIALMPDLLHPNAEGHEILADCILQNV
uniref:SGNH hydrolase-type esterase domain-containing protein n=1 Tax=Fibrocapsa japonica TaxID=94617 RepID=A0A7S2XX19_9STRA